MKQSYKSYSLAGFPGIPFEYIKVLESVGIRNTGKFLAESGSEARKNILSKNTGIPVDRLNELRSLANLVKINGIGHVTARILYETGITSLSSLASSEIKNIYLGCMHILGKRNYPTYLISKPKIRNWIQDARSRNY